MTAKRHHYVPKAYLRYFCDKQGRVQVYLKDDPDRVIHQTPDNTGFHKYYYSQPSPEGGRDDESLEKAFSTLETKWPPIVEKIHRRENVNDSIEDIFAFIGLQRVRVPATRDAIEVALANSVMATTRFMGSIGKLPPLPKGAEDILDRLEVAVDPHRSLHAMAGLLEAMGKVFDQIGICVLHNTTDIPFLTSDNPVVWFDPSVSDDKMQPYNIVPGGPINLLFPIAPNMMIYGDSELLDRFVRKGVEYHELNKRRLVKKMNRKICCFAYSAVFAQERGHEALIRKYANISPVIQTSEIPDGQGQLVVHQLVFGERKQKPKWDNKSH